MQKPVLEGREPTPEELSAVDMDELEELDDLQIAYHTAVVRCPPCLPRPCLMYLQMARASFLDGSIIIYYCVKVEAWQANDAEATRGEAVDAEDHDMVRFMQNDNISEERNLSGWTRHYNKNKSTRTPVISSVLTIRQGDPETTICRNSLPESFTTRVPAMARESVRGMLTRYEKDRERVKHAVVSLEAEMKRRQAQEERIAKQRAQVTTVQLSAIVFLISDPCPAANCDMIGNGVKFCSSCVPFVHCMEIYHRWRDGRVALSSATMECAHIYRQE